MESTPKTCSIEGCGGALKSRDYCQKHYTRLKKHGDPLYVRVRAKGCSVEGCDSPLLAKGMCGPHYNRKRRKGDPLYEHPVPQPCVIEDCDRPRKGGGYCQKHYYRLHYGAGDPLVVRPPGAPAGVDHPCYRGDDIGYTAVHVRLRKKYGKAAGHPCADCGMQAYDWAYDGLDPDEVMEFGKVYSLKQSHYVTLCRSCHVYLDYERFRKPGRIRRSVRERQAKATA